MKIAIASDDGVTISSHFGRTKGFVIAEIENKQLKDKKYLPNTFTGHAMGLHHDEQRHGHGNHAGIISALSDCVAVISHGMGKRLYDDLTQAGKEVYVTDEVEVDKAIEQYLNGRLKNVSELLH
ncbi:NifB/NifX family molybdenum-iron cluster-binding protein [Pseudothermotoga sp. U03pept]|uniref:NifB/NifX family molybdenum-iron cluster-binding protein n=1 Tax=Pseudothermotoga sp. U03pept TaxID=3447012 RepID=UPI003EFFDE57